MIYDNEENAIVNTQPQVSETPANLVGKGDANEKQLSPNPASFGFVKQVIVDTLPVSNQEVDTLYLLKVKNNGEVVGYKKYRWTKTDGYVLLSGATPDLIVNDGVREQKAVEVNDPKPVFEKIFNGNVAINYGELYINGKKLQDYIDSEGGVTEEELRIALLDYANRNIAPDYNSSSSYVVGDLVNYNGNLYQCVNDTTGTFVVADWSAITVSAALGSAGMENPMTTAGDIIYGGADGVPTRLAKGTAGQVLAMNSGATAPEWKDAIPTISIELSQLVSQDPLQIQLTQAQALVLANNLQVIIDASALDFPTVIWQYEVDDSSYGWFVSPSSVSGGVGFYQLRIDKSTAIATLLAAKDVEVGNIYNGSGYTGEYENYLAAGNSTYGLKMTNGLPYLTTAPSANNTEGNIKIVVLSSEPATKYDGFIYIITGSNS